jgi:nucleoside-diphosphate-sugar epimerase
MKNRVIISGITGFVGKKLKKYLNNNNCVIYSYNRKNLSNQLISKDIMIHLAGKAHDLKKSSNWEDYYQSNYKLTKRIYDDFLKSDTKKFIFVSSIKAVKDSYSGILSEEIIPDPKTHYGKSKLLAEKYIFENVPQNKKVYILRPSLIYGEGIKGNLSFLIRMIKKGFPWIFASFKNQRTFCSVHNISFVIKKLINNNSVKSGIYNVCDDDSISTNDLVKIISNKLEKKILFIKIPTIIIKMLFKVGDIFNLSNFNSNKLKKLTESYKVSNKKIKKYLKINQMPVKIKTGFNKLITPN